MPFTAAQIEEARRSAKEQENAERDLVRRLIDAVRLWQRCEHRQCRRMQRCVETATCQETYADDIFRWKREQLLPYLRQRYPTVQWGAPASIVEAQVEAAVASEEAKAHGERRADGKSTRKRRRKRVPRQPLYTPRDFVDGAGGGAP